MEILPSNRFESHSQIANGLKRPFGVKNDKYGPCHGADFYKNDTLSRSRNPENDTLFSSTSPYGRIYEYPLPGGGGAGELNHIRVIDDQLLPYEIQSFPNTLSAILIIMVMDLNLRNLPSATD